MKKTINLLLLFALVIPAFSQNLAQTNILNELNSYRNKNGLPSVKYSEELSKAANHHATYLSMCPANGIGHDEPIDLPNWIEYSFQERFEKLSQKGFLVESEIQLRGAGENQIDIIQFFDKSKDHSESMKSPSPAIVGIANVRGNTVIVFGNLK